MFLVIAVGVVVAMLIAVYLVDRFILRPKGERTAQRLLDAEKAEDERPILKDVTGVHYWDGQGRRATR